MTAASLPLGAEAKPAYGEPHVTVARTFEEVASLRAAWTRMNVHHIDCEIDYFLAVAGTADEVIGPYVIHARLEGGRSLIVAARLENLPVRFRLGYWSLGSTTLRAIVVAFDGVLGATGPEDETMVAGLLRRALAEGDADIVLMRHVEHDGPRYRALQHSFGHLRRAGGRRIDRRWITPLPDSLESMLKSRSAKSRSSFRREDKLLLNEFGDRLQLRRFDRMEDMDRFCRDMASVARRTYQHGLGAGYADSRMERALVALGLARGTYRCWMLYVDDEPIAFWAGMAQGDTFYPITPGFDPAYGRHSIGRYTMFRMFEDLCADPDVTKIDFGRGDAQYKTEYSKVTALVTDMWLASARAKPMIVVCLLSALAAASARAGELARRLKLTSRLKTFWRRRLAAKSVPGEARQ